MKYLKELSSLKMFNKKDVISVCGNIHNANYVLKSYIDKGYITKTKKDYFVINDLVNDTSAANKYEIACGNGDNDFISHHSVLEFTNTDTSLKNKLALKGGMVINLTFYDYLRLSVDIDLEYVGSVDREQMIIERGIIETKILNYMQESKMQYRSDETKKTHA